MNKASEAIEACKAARESKEELARKRFVREKKDRDGAATIGDLQSEMASVRGSAQARHRVEMWDQ